MKSLCYSTLQDIGHSGYLLPDGPERILQFGEGNFLRAFADAFIDIANERLAWNTKCVVVQPIPQGRVDALNRQQGLYTLYLRGVEQGQRHSQRRVVSSVSRGIDPYQDFAAYLALADNPDLRFILSNTTEAGIVFDPACGYHDDPPASFPGKLTRLLHQRYLRMGQKPGSGFVLLPCELIDDNARELEKCVLQYIQHWNLDDGFRRWVQEENHFCPTLVDRIVTGYPAAEAEAMERENGYRDELLDTGELFGLWVIEGPEWLQEELPFVKAGLPVLITDDHKPYKTRKVRILNGAHTAFVPAAYLAGFDLVRDCMDDPVIRAFLERALYQEILPVLPLPEEESKAFAASVFERFANPYIDHRLLDITLNCTSKWRARVLPSLKESLALTGKLPQCLTFSFAAYLRFFAAGQRDGAPYPTLDDAPVLAFFQAHKGDAPEALARAAASQADWWGEDLTQLPGFVEAVTHWLSIIDDQGAYQALTLCGEETP